MRVIKACDLIEKVKKEPTPKVIWSGIVEGSKGLITGVPKTGKTTFAENLAMSMAVGRKEFFGQPMDGTPRKVLFVSLEEDYRLRCRRNIKQLVELNDVENQLFDENYLTIDGSSFDFIENDEDWQDLSDVIMESEADIIFIDSLSHMVSGEIERSKVMMDFVKKFRKHIPSSSKTIVVVHHNVKDNSKPMSMENVAGSRVIMQEFEYAYGMSNIPNEEGGKYFVELWNKHKEVDSNKATKYEFNENCWIDDLGDYNKHSFYKEVKPDFRKNELNKEMILKYFESMYSQGSSDLTMSDLMESLVKKEVMSKPTLHENLKKLMTDNKIVRLKHGLYSLPKNIST